MCLFPFLYFSSFRLLTEYHSFLYGDEKKIIFKTLKGFPSPYGVSFILIYCLEVANDYKFKLGFRLLTEYHSFLSIDLKSLKKLHI